MRSKRIDKVELTSVLPEHRVLFLGLRDSPSIQAPPALRQAFILYAKDNLREFPWREPGILPYHLLLAELLLVQTKAADVATIWPVLIRRYPTTERLAHAPVRSLVNLLRPLGLQNQRANALRNLSRYLAREWAGQLPKTIIGLLSLPHVGLYSAAAVSCFSNRRRVPIVDANIMRVFARIFRLPLMRELRRSRRAWAIAWALLPRRNTAIHNYGLLDFAAAVCTPKAPRCGACQIRAYCAHGRTQTVHNRIHTDKLPSSPL